MFSSTTYQQRRALLKKQLTSGVILFLGNPDSPMNYPDNVYPFRQDSSFLYYCGLNLPRLAMIIDLDNDEEYLVGRELETIDIIVSGPQPSLVEQAESSGIKKVISWGQAEELIKKVAMMQRPLHYVPQYRAENQILLANWLNCIVNELKPSLKLINAIVEQRLYKSAEEVEQISQALVVTTEIHIAAMKLTTSGKYERDVVAELVAIAQRYERQFSYPIIFTVRGEVLHNVHYDNQMQTGQLVLNDSGVNSPFSYASDITRTFPVNGRFSSKQRDIYQLVYEMQKTALDMLRPGINYRDVHLAAAYCGAEGLIQLGLMQGDPAAIVEQGAYAMFFPHGVGHPLGLDVHDMEGLGEENVGYTEGITRSMQFGLNALRFAKPLTVGHVMTVEPGIYFGSLLIQQWREQGKFKEFINYDALNDYLDFGGVRIEDNIIITNDGYRNLSADIPSELDKVEAICNQ